MQTIINPTTPSRDRSSLKPQSSESLRSSVENYLPTQASLENILSNLTDEIKFFYSRGEIPSSILLYGSLGNPVGQIIERENYLPNDIRVFYGPEKYSQVCKKYSLDENLCPEQLFSINCEPNIISLYQGRNDTIYENPYYRN